MERPWNERIRYIRDLELPAPQKLVLWQLFGWACPACGFAWPGVDLLAGRSGLGRRSVGMALRHLVRAGHLRPHGYERGGRGRVTQYFVLPALTKLSATPCQACRGKLAKSAIAEINRVEQNRARGAQFVTESRTAVSKRTRKRVHVVRGNDNSITNEAPKPPDLGLESAQNSTVNRAPGAHQEERPMKRIPEVRARGAPVVAAPKHRSTPHLTDAEAKARARQMVDDLNDHVAREKQRNSES